MRYVLPLCVLATVGLILVLNSTSTRQAPDDSFEEVSHIPNYSFAEMRQIHARARDLDEVMTRRQQFTPAYDAARQAVWDGEIDLFAAADRAIVQAKEHNPLFVTVACRGFPHLSEREAVAAVILRVLHVETQTRGAAQGCSRERYEDLLCELSASAELTPALAAEVNERLATLTEAPRHRQRSLRNRAAW